MRTDSSTGPRFSLVRRQTAYNVVPMHMGFRIVRFPANPAEAAELALSACLTEGSQLVVFAEHPDDLVIVHAMDQHAACPCHADVTPLNVERLERIMLVRVISSRGRGHGRLRLAHRVARGRFECWQPGGLVGHRWHPMVVLERPTARRHGDPCHKPGCPSPTCDGDRRHSAAQVVTTDQPGSIGYSSRAVDLDDDGGWRTGIAIHPPRRPPAPTVDPAPAREADQRRTARDSCEATLEQIPAGSTPCRRAHAVGLAVAGGSPACARLPMCAPATSFPRNVVVVSGKASGPDVTLQAFIGRRWQSLAHARAHGSYALSVRAPRAVGVFDLRVLQGRAVSKTLHVRVVTAAFRVTAAATSASYQAAPLVVTGTVSPVTAGNVQLQRLVDGAWVTLASGVIGDGGRYSVTSVQDPGSYGLRVLKTFSASRGQGVSESFNVVVLPATSVAPPTVVPPTPGPPVVTTSAALPAAMVGAPYQVLFAATGGTGPYTWSADSLPTGLQLSSDGHLTGTPTQAGDAVVVVTVTDTAGRTTQATFSLAVAPAPSVLSGWGANATGQFGDAIPSFRDDPARPAELQDATAVGTGRDMVYVVTAAGAVLAWGVGSSGELGDGRSRVQHYPGRRQRSQLRRDGGRRGRPVRHRAQERRHGVGLGVGRRGRARLRHRQLLNAGAGARPVGCHGDPGGQRRGLRAEVRRHRLVLGRQLRRPAGRRRDGRPRPSGAGDRPVPSRDCHRGWRRRRLRPAERRHRTGVGPEQ